jgi:serine/threonine protein kinase
MPDQLGSFVLLEIKPKRAGLWNAAGHDSGASQSCQMIFADHLRKPELGRQILRTAAILRRFSSEMIADYMGHGRTERHTFLATELVTPRARLKESVTESESDQDILALGIRLCEVLELIHSQGVCHRNISPHTVCLRPDGTPFLTDFSRALADNECPDGTKTEAGTTNHGSLTRSQWITAVILDTRAVAGTLGWMMTGIRTKADDKAATQRLTDAIEASAHSSRVKAAVIGGLCTDTRSDSVVVALKSSLESADRRLRLRRKVRLASLVTLTLAVPVVGVAMWRTSTREPIEQQVNTISAEQVRLDAITPQLSRIEQTAALTGVAPGRFSAEDFVPTLEFSPPPAPKGTLALRPYSAGRVLVQPSPRAADFLSHLQFRFGDTGWRIFLVDVNEHIKYGQIKEEDFARGGLLQLRLNGLTHDQGGQISGPFTFNIDVRDARDKQWAETIEELKSQLTKADWLAFETAREFWLGTDVFNRDSLPYMTTLVVGPTPDQLDFEVSLDICAPMEHAMNPDTPTEVDNIRDVSSNLALAINNRKTPHLVGGFYAAVRFVDGSISTPCEFRAPPGLSNAPVPTGLRQHIAGNLLITSDRYYLTLNNALVNEQWQYIDGVTFGPANQESELIKVRRHFIQTGRIMAGAVHNVQSHVHQAIATLQTSTGRIQYRVHFRDGSVSDWQSRSFPTAKR